MESTGLVFPVSGETAAGFEPVREAFGRELEKDGGLGAALHVLVDGEPVVDLWGGAADLGGTRPWGADSLVNVWSATKGSVALAMHMLADEGKLDFDAPVADYWPEFARRGKGGVLVRHALSHTSGLPAPSVRVPDEALYDWEAMIAALEGSELFWEPGTRMGYHAASFGWLNGEILRRVEGLSFGEFLRSRISGPLGADIFVGLGRSEEERAAETKPPELLSGPLGRLALRAANAIGGKARAMAMGNPPRPLAAVNTRRWREAQIPSSNGHASARGLARLYAPLASGGEAFGRRLLSPGAVERAAREEARGRDLVTGSVERRSLGFMLPVASRGDPRPEGAFGHLGMGGSIGFADPARRLAFGYATGRMREGVDGRWERLYGALRACLPGR